MLKTAAALAPAHGTIGVDLLPAAITRTTATPQPESGLDLVKREAACAALAKAGGNYSAAARLLGISRTTLYKYLGDPGLG